MSDLETEPVFSPCRQWRYTLPRQLPALTATRGVCAFLMLNPSTADEIKNDPTIRRCIGFASAFGFARLVVVNLFAWRSTDPAGLRTAADPIGPDNDEHIRRIATGAELVVAAWGAASKVRALVQPRAAAVCGQLERAGVQLHALRVTQGGAPEHPLYLSRDLRPIRWSP